MAKKDVPNAGHQHEVLHTIFILQENIENYVVGNKLFADVRFRNAKDLVQQAQDLLNDAYQEVGGIDF